AVLEKKNVSIEFSPEVASWLFDRCGIDPQAGARPLRRLVKLWVEDPVADYLIQHRDGEGADLRMWVEEERPVVAAMDASAVIPGGDAR
ncbi:MAG: hypothetical protein OQK55_04260, partial [Thermoanaerobaculales bacterium]|nr:hypothetical protein [Thermoanaerobaculales bacterium]